MTPQHYLPVLDIPIMMNLLLMLLERLAVVLCV